MTGPERHALDVASAVVDRAHTGALAGRLIHADEELPVIRAVVILSDQLAAEVSAGIALRARVAELEAQLAAERNRVTDWMNI